MIIRHCKISVEVDEECVDHIVIDAHGMTPEEVYGYVESVAARMRCDIIGGLNPLLISLFKEREKKHE